ncbi:glycosyltransferase family 4 protein [Coleofasciculus sp. FACHB-1120]|uniref:glycosyltransferase family 4 protein n=1 Tax=Coleofasciculus sp. FACHB-1120 TaxID=2692783 RepID=UPI00168301DE|nr:glycosyltransferase family 4 protein [Coleofasciculus sp. FACHB-1120]MBD2744242.1 glycosyltransferase family 4 protein [Coleofasciculus sp. FACHB-1120]
MNDSRIAYISFDTVPAPKGAAIHIAAFTQALADAFGDIQLVTVSPTAYAVNQRESPHIIQSMLPALGDTLINRVLYFRTMLGNWWQNQWFEAVHIRSIYEGFPIALNKEKLCKHLIFEVNGLPSIELKYRYPAVADDRELLHKLKAQEKICLEASDLILTPSSVTRDYLQTRGVPDSKIRVIPNGVDLNIFTYRPSKFRDAEYPNLPNQDREPPKTQPRFRVLYFGTFSPWQGINLAVEALALADRDFPTQLTVIGQGRDFQILALKQLALKLGVAESLTILDPVSQAELVQKIHASDVILAPLTPNDRNLVQGCCPLKILEGMATGTPVIASDLPVVRELGVDGVHFLLVKPGSAKEIKDALLRLKTEPELAINLARNARQQIENDYTWKHAGDALVAAYEELGIKRSITV